MFASPETRKKERGKSASSMMGRLLAEVLSAMTPLVKKLMQESR
ncbi:hypothetical protein ACFMBG_14855 [Leisingera sp. D0M16]